MKPRDRLAIGIGIIILLIGVFSFLSLEHIGAENQAKGRIAYVDVWTVFNVHPDKGNAERELNQLAQTMQSELEEKARDLPKDEQQNMLKEYQSRLSQKEQELIQQIIDGIKDVIIEVAEEKEVKIVLDKKNVIYGGYDMTQDVIEYISQNTEQTEQDNTPAPDNNEKEN